MDLHQLHVFRSAALNGSFTTASEELHISQSTVSLHVKNLEDELGCQLFFRAGRHVGLSPAGKLLLEHAEKILEAVQTSKTAVGELNMQPGPIRLGAIESALENRLPSALKEFSRQFHQVKLLIMAGETELLINLMKAQKLDLAVITLPVLQSGLKTISLGREELVLVIPGNDPLTRRGQPSAADLAGLSFILYEKQTSIRSLVDDWFRDLGIVPRVVMEMGSLASMKAMVRIGLGASVLPACALSDDPAKDGLHKVPFPEKPLYRELGLALHDTDYLPGATRELTVLLSKALANS